MGVGLTTGIPSCGCLKTPGHRWHHQPTHDTGPTEQSEPEEKIISRALCQTQLKIGRFFVNPPILLITFSSFHSSSRKRYDGRLHKVHLGLGAALLSGCVYQPTVAPGAPQDCPITKKDNVANLNSPNFEMTLRNSAFSDVRRLVECKVNNQHWHLQ